MWDSVVTGRLAGACSRVAWLRVAVAITLTQQITYSAARTIIYAPAPVSTLPHRRSTQVDPAIMSSRFGTRRDWMAAFDALFKREAAVVPISRRHTLGRSVVEAVSEADKKDRIRRRYR